MLTFTSNYFPLSNKKLMVFSKVGSQWVASSEAIYIGICVLACRLTYIFRVFLGVDRATQHFGSGCSSGSEPVS